MATGDKLIQVKDLKKYYNRGAIKALDGVTVDIDRGDGDGGSEYKILNRNT